MKTAISIPDEVFRQAEQAAKRLGMTRSELFTRAVRDFLGIRRERAITASYDEAFADGSDDLDQLRTEASRRSLLSVEWNER
jgi:predicted transcriptional regulator